MANAAPARLKDDTGHEVEQQAKQPKHDDGPIAYIFMAVNNEVKIK
jgi:hypothetical protein